MKGETCTQYLTLSSVLKPISSFSSGTDAAGYSSSDISACTKLAMKSVHGCTLFMMRQRRCGVYLQKGVNIPRQPAHQAARWDFPLYWGSVLAESCRIPLRQR